MNARGP